MSQPHEGFDELDSLFAQARQTNADDLAATEGLVTVFRNRRRRSLGLRLGAVLAPLVACAAVVGGVLVVQSRDLPASAAYAVYQQASGGDW